MQMRPDHKPALERHMHGLQICEHEAEAQRGEGKPAKASGAAPGADAAGQDRHQRNIFILRTDTKGKSMKCYKGFDKDMKCRGFQYEEGKTYEEEKAELCNTGFHACEDPLDIFGYYPPADSKYHEVELEEITEERSKEDTKICGRRITIGAEIGIPGIVKAHVEYVKANVKKAVEAGDAKAVAVGDEEAASAGDSGSASAGDRGSASAGYRGSVSSLGKSSVGKNGCAIARGNGAMVRGGMGAVLVLVEENASDCDIRFWKSKEVDGERIKENTWYMLDSYGEFKEVEE